MGNAIQWTIQHLGAQCIVCGNTDTHALEIYHVYGQGYLEKEYFQNKDMFEFYVEYWEHESKYLQVRCVRCNIESKESTVTLGPTLKELEKFLILKKEDYSNLCGPELEEVQKKREVQLQQFLKNNPQFVPIYERIDYLMTNAFEPDDFTNNLDYNYLVFKSRLKWLPKPYDEILVNRSRDLSKNAKDIKEERIKKYLKHRIEGNNTNG